MSNGAEPFIATVDGQDLKSGAKNVLDKMYALTSQEAAEVLFAQVFAIPENAVNAVNAVNAEIHENA